MPLLDAIANFLTGSNSYPVRDTSMASQFAAQKAANQAAVLQALGADQVNPVSSGDKGRVLDYMKTGIDPNISKADAVNLLSSALPTTPAAPVPQQYAGDKQLILDIMRGNIPPDLAIARENKLTPVAKEQRDRTSQEFVQKKGEQGSAANKRTETLINVLAQLGVPLGAAIAGSVNPNFLPQAAGLAGGYVGGYQNQQEIARKQAAEQAKNSETRDVYVLDDSGALQKVGNVPATSIVRNPPQQDIFGSLLKSGAVGQASQNTPDEAAKVKEKTAKVKKGAYEIGQIINRNGIQYRVTNIDDPNDPDLEKVK